MKQPYPGGQSRGLGTSCKITLEHYLYSNEIGYSTVVPQS